MVKIKYILIMIVSFFFLSCESVYLDMNDVHCRLDKSTYKKDEPITISYDGSFKDSSETGLLRLYFNAYKIIDEKREGLQILSFSPSDTPYFSSGYDNGMYYFIIKENEKMTDYNGAVHFFIPEEGRYDLVVWMYGHTPKHYYGGTQYFTFPITITE